ncbi:MAG: type II toxin-antitoxin system MqsR family toxin [Gammaproteobacteria bacterium]|nr:type II toxin-antitoxin system MqsR family toxin [Gammaproteobacteria bacterium]MBU1655013.1 type II toxin-antitoxin system MqsR family toxin [Gammaproteobacteria bacterium]MBU1960034.1 type II toxin-antitoxin system MqsR family toxin [Gammaproteobacteria bacterium]
MEKRTPHCKLSVAKALVEAGKVRMTNRAVEDADLLGFDRAGMIRVVLALTTSDFYKST